MTAEDNFMYFTKTVLYLTSTIKLISRDISRKYLGNVFPNESFENFVFRDPYLYLSVAFPKA